MTTETEWAHPELLCETEWLAAHLDDPDVVAVDCDLLPAYQRLHIPGAVWSSSHYWKSDPRNDSELHALEDAATFADLAAGLGIGETTRVVAYDGSGGLYAARMWWTFDRFGHERFQVLHGGLDKWVAEGRPLSRENLRAQRGSYAVPASPQQESICRLADVRALREEDEHVFWDVRSAGEWSGANKRGTARGGRIPGAVHLEWLQTLEEPVRTLKAPAELRRLLAALGVTPDKRVTTY